MKLQRAWLNRSRQLPWGAWIKPALRRCDGFEYPEPGHKVPCNEKATYLGSGGAFCSFHVPRGGCVRLDAI